MESSMTVEGLYRLFREHPVVTTDSRDCPDRSIFIALRGASFNGNAFAGTALAAGCSYAVVDDEAAAARLRSDGYGSRTVLVEDCLKTFQFLAREHRRALGTTVIGITGTNGKTTTKELTAAVLSKRYSTLFTQGNYNNDIGVPKTLLRLTEQHDIAVVEMGASHPGDIRTLVNIVEPDCGLITNVGQAHLQGFGSFEGVLRTKGELYDFLRTKADSVTFINHKDKDLMSIASGLPHIVRYAHGEVTACDPFLHFVWGEEQKYEVSTRLIGAYNVHNCMAAVTIGLHFGVSPEAICEAIEEYTPTNNRSQLIITPHNRLIVDAYNANPTSMAAALDNFRLMDGHKLAILGDMGELGAASHEEHAKVVSQCEAYGLDAWLVGGEFSTVPSPYRVFTDVDAVRQEFSSHPLHGYTILIKGSHSMRLYELAANTAVL